MSYSFHRSITFDHTKCGASSSTDFPALFFGTYTYLKTTGNGGDVQHTVSSGGQTVPADMIFTSDSAGMTLLKWEVESYDATTGEIAVWIKIPSMSHTVDTVIYIFYGDATVTTFQGDINGTWNSNYHGVWHLPNGSSITANDSTSFGHNGTITSVSATTGQVYGGGNSATGDIALVDSTDYAVSSITLSTWVNLTDILTNQIMVRDSTGAVAPGRQFQFRLSAGVVQWIFFVPGVVILQSLSTVNDGNWHLVAVTYDGTTDHIYIDGVLDNSSTDPGTLESGAGSKLYLCSREGDSSNNFNGKVDEFRFVATALGVDWLLTEFNNQNSPSTFYVVSNPITPGGTSLFRVGNLSGLGSGGPFFHDPL